MSKHAVIAGTGRAGTTFLVRFLSDCGVPTGALDQLEFFDTAQAGLERPLNACDAPYLIKDPWFSEYCESLDLAQVSIEALIVPVRDLRDAAFSRVFQEKIHITANPHSRNFRTVNGGAPGGAVYSLSVIDQERVLATQQARLLAWAVQHEVPIYFLDFPRLIKEFEYIYRILEPWLSRFASMEVARAAHTALADAGKIRINRADDDKLDDVDLMAERAALLFNLSRADGQIEDLRTQVSELSCRVEELMTANSRLLQSRAKLKAEVRQRSEELDRLLSSESLKVGRIVLSPLRWLKWLVSAVKAG